MSFWRMRSCTVLLLEASSRSEKASGRKTPAPSESEARGRCSAGAAGAASKPASKPAPAAPSGIAAPPGPPGLPSTENSAPGDEKGASGTPSYSASVNRRNVRRRMHSRAMSMSTLDGS